MTAAVAAKRHAPTAPTNTHSRPLRRCCSSASNFRRSSPSGSSACSSSRNVRAETTCARWLSRKLELREELRTRFAGALADKTEPEPGPGRGWSVGRGRQRQPCTMERVRSETRPMLLDRARLRGWSSVMSVGVVIASSSKHASWQWNEASSGSW
eukprot:3603660-Rhodomonas_salina.2